MVIDWIQNVHAVHSEHSRSQTTSGVGSCRALLALEQFSGVGGLIELFSTFMDTETCLPYTPSSKSLSVPQVPPLSPGPQESYVTIFFI